MRRGHYVLVGCAGVLVLLALAVWSSVSASTPSGVLTVAFLDVGQGDAIFVESPTGAQVLIDGGKGRSVLRGLGALMAPGDRSLDVVMATHPDLDHIGGLPEVFARYEVGLFLEPGVSDDGSDAAALYEAVAAEGLAPIQARAGMKLALGGGAFLEVLFPEGDVSAFEVNTASIIVRVVYGDTSFMLSGDAPSSIETYLAGKHGTRLSSQVLKLGHHGSKTSTGEAFLGAVLPNHAVISAGCDNSYGHPHAEVLERLRRFQVETVSTCESGTIVFSSDGVTISRAQR